MKKITLIIAGLTLNLLIEFNALGIDIYNSYTGYNNNAFQVQNGQQIGNEIKLSSANVILTGFNFEYFTSPTLASTVGVELRFYKNDGAPFNGFATPGTLFYDSGVFSPVTAAPGAGPPSSASGGADVNYSVAGGDFPLNFSLPTDFTFTLTFTGLAVSNSLSLLLANQPSGQIGSTTPDYWFNTGSGWSLNTYSVVPDLGVEFIGTVKAPDAPATAGLLGLGFMGILALRCKINQ